MLIANARLVEVGLNLVMFPTAIFFEAEWSLYVLWQAMRRVFRPGAPLPVELHFPVYAGTMEQYLLDLIGQKMKAAQTFYGDEVGGALIETDEGDLLADLIRQRLARTHVGRADGLFGVENNVSGSLFGSPTAAGAIGRSLVSWTDLAVRRHEVVAQCSTRRKKKEAPKGQIGPLL